jgi:glutamine amidotransferase-like uncharacterized protein
MKYNKIFQGYNANDLILNFQLCKAYFNDNCSIVQIVEKILLERFHDLSFKERARIKECHGKSNALISLPRLGFEANVHDILKGYVEKRFDKMVAEAIGIKKSTYPQKFRDLIERLS